MRRGLLGVGLVIMLALAAQAAQGAEARCTALGVNCICSEPFQMTGFTHFSTNEFHNPNDSTTKQCDIEQSLTGGWAIARVGWDYTVGTDAAILAALPAGHSVQRFLKGSVSAGGIQIGHFLKAGDPHARIAHRIYLYFSPDFDFKFERDGSKAYYNSTSDFNGVCQNTKFGESGPLTQGLHWDISVEPQIYGFLVNHTPALDCCNGPIDGVPSIGVTTASWKGKWWRVEFVIRNATGSPGIVYEAWRKNVTDNLPEQKILGTSVACPDCGGAQGWTQQAATQLVPQQRQDFVYSNQYRQNGTTYNCKGHYAWSHSLTAAWSTDSGQRIGAATEVEGGGPAPLDILATQGTYGLIGGEATLIPMPGPTLIGFVHRAAVVVVIVAVVGGGGLVARRWSRGRRERRVS